MALIQVHHGAASRIIHLASPITAWGWQVAANMRAIASVRQTSFLRKWILAAPSPPCNFQFNTFPLPPSATVVFLAQSPNFHVAVSSACVVTLLSAWLARGATLLPPSFFSPSTLRRRLDPACPPFHSRELLPNLAHRHGGCRQHHQRV